MDNGVGVDVSGAPDGARIRGWFPALSGETVFLDNAGGSQVPRCVADAIREYMLTKYVQLGADYAASRRASETYRRAHGFVNTLVNGEGIGEVILGSSSSALLRMLADCYADSPAEGRDEVVVCDSGHESNVGSWLRLAHRGYRVRTWGLPSDGARACDVEDLAPMLSERTRLVVFPQTSNIFGEVTDLRPIVEAAHGVGARVVVDGVAFAPHQAVDVRAWGVDWYVYSAYKVYGPHMGALFGTRGALSELTGPNHFFIDKSEYPRKFELGSASHEGCAGLLALGEYLSFLAGEEPPGEGGEVPRRTVERAFAAMRAREMPLQKRLVEYLAQRGDVRLLGPRDGGAGRVATVSFTHRERTSREIALAANERGLGIRYGNFYSYRLCESLGLDPADGVVRASMVHYNTLGEVERLIEFFEGYL